MRLGIVAIMTFALFFVGCSNEGKVQKSRLEFDQSKTIGEALAGFKDCKTLQWESYKQGDREAVRARCDVTPLLAEEFARAIKEAKEQGLVAIPELLDLYAAYLDRITGITYDFVFLAKEGGDFGLHEIRIPITLKGKQEALELRADEAMELMRMVYENGTLKDAVVLANPNIPQYAAYALSALSHDREIVSEIYGNPALELDATKAFGLELGVSHYKDAIRRIPRVFSEGGFAKREYEEQGIYLQFDAQGLLENQKSLILGFDRAGILRYIRSEFDSKEQGNDVFMRFEKLFGELKTVRQSNDIKQSIYDAGDFYIILDMQEDAKSVGIEYIDKNLAVMGVEVVE